MAHLLGSKTCIDSLRVDIDDLEHVIHEIIGRTGSLKCHSWKYPDKLATDVNISELLDRYQYGHDELDNQVSHVVLFEIVIDRLLLVIHGSWRFLHEIQTKSFPNIVDSSSTIHQQVSLNIGLVVKKYWNKLLNIFTVLQQHENTRKRSTPSLLKATSHTEQSSQTIDTSFGPCSSCLKLQQYLRDYGDTLITLCDIYDLPSSLSQHRCSLSIIPEWLSSQDLKQWCDCQSADVDLVSKHLEYLNETLIQTRVNLQSSENHCQKQTEVNRRLEQVINDEKQATKNLQESQEKIILDLKKEHEQNRLNSNQQIQLLTKEKREIEQKFNAINDECKSRGEQLLQIEPLKNDLQSLKEDRTRLNTLVKSLEDDRIRLQTQLDVIRRDLDERTRDLQKERMRIENMIRQEENHQSKQQSLVKSHDELSEECQSLKKQLIDLKQDRESFEQQNHSLTENNQRVLQEVASLKQHLEQLQQQSLEQYSHFNKADRATSHLLHDMQNQMQTNEQQIDFLQKQNQTLEASLVKLNVETAHATKPKQRPLWLLNSEIVEQQQAFTQIKPTNTANHLSHSTENDHAANRWSSDQNADVLPHRHDRSWATGSTSIHPTNLQLNIQAHQTFNNSRTPLSDHGKGRPPARPLSSTRSRSALPKSSRTISSAKSHLRCANCNQSYNDKRQYDIHKLHCRT